MRARRLLPALFVSCALVPLVRTPHAQRPAITMAGYPALGETAKVVLLSAGREPRQALRYDIPATFKGRIEMAVNTNVAETMMGRPITLPIPPIKLAIDLAVTTIAANGDITYNIGFANATVDGNASSPFAMQLRTITAVKGTTTMTNRGLTRATNLNVANPALKSSRISTSASIENLSVAFPEEAVGGGARWETRYATGSGGEIQFQKAVYEITAVDGAAISLKVTTEATAPVQAIDPSGAPTGAELMLDKMTGSGAGTVTIHLDSLTPTSSIEQTMSMAGTLKVQGQSMAMTTDSKIRITIAPVK